MAPTVPGTPPDRRKPWGLYAGIAGVVTAVLIVGGIFAKSALTSAKDQPRDVPTVTKDPQTPTGQTAAPGFLPSATAQKTMHTVVVALDPSDAKVERDGSEGVLQNPVVLQLGDGETATLKISRVGYAPQTVTVDAREPSRLVKLVPAPTAKSSATTKPTSTKGGSGEFVDLWKK
jgi:hypothetical protein